MKAKIESHRRFWSGEGPSLLLVPTETGPLYDTANYDQRFNDPRLMWEAEMRRARAVLDWPTDGIPTVRPNLGVIYVPAIAGQGYQLNSDQMPWPGEPLEWEAIRATRSVDVNRAELMLRVEEFYRIHHAEAGTEVAAYHPDTQGVFDVAHLLYGDEIFTALAGDDSEQARIVELMEICLDLYLRVTRRIKELLAEPAGSMIHGHGTAQGIFFPRGGARISEDTLTMLSPAMIDRAVMPYIRRSLEPFDGGFAHFCGLHRPFFERLCACELVRAIDLGNPEKYDIRWLLEQSATSGTVLYSRLPALDGEGALACVKRIGTLVRETGARVVLRATVVPRSRNEAAEMLTAWQELTMPRKRLGVAEQSGHEPAQASISQFATIPE
jgi:hypothetical protein